MRFLKVTLLSSLLFPLGAAYDANPLKRDTGKAGLTISAKVNTAGVGNIAERDRARVQDMKSALYGGDSLGRVNVSNALFFYTVQVGVGFPPAYYTLLVDTGSSNTWVGASQPYVPTNSSLDTGNSVSVSYGSGFFSGEEWLDSVTLSPDLIIVQQSIGVANLTEGFNGVDGILGLGPVDLTENTVNDTFQVPTILDNLYTQKEISQEVLGVFFPPASELDGNGSLTFGDYDDAVTTSPVNYVPLTTSYPAARYWGINESISYGDADILSSNAGIVDTGTTLVLIASDAFQKYKNLTGGTLDPTTGLLTITSAQYSELETLWFSIGDASFGLTPNAQIWPRSLNNIIGGNSSTIYLVVNDIGFPSGSGFDFCNGYSFLQRFYTIFDIANKRFGIAETIYTDSTTN